MAKLIGGIGGKVVNRLGGHVYSTWKGINTVRTHVIPSNPNTSAQQTVRGNFARLVYIGRAVYSEFISTYWNNLVKGKANSGWAAFMGHNQKQIANATDLRNIRLATGDLEGVKTIEVTLDTNNNSVNIDWEKTMISNGNLDDKVIAYVYSPERNYIYAQATPAIRGDEQVKVPYPDLDGGGDNNVIIITLISTSGKYSTSQTELFTI